MRVGHVQPSRANYYDRTATSRSKTYIAGGLAPHASTDRWTYTVPSGRKTFIQSIMCRVMRQTVAAPAGLIDNYVELTTVAGDGATRIAQSGILTNAVGDKDGVNYGAVGLAVAGDIIKGTTSDASTGGTMAFYNAMWFVEYDA